jgi:hypothetical protein
MAYFPDRLVNGITHGAVYGLIAIGYARTRHHRHGQFRPRRSVHDRSVRFLVAMLMMFSSVPVASIVALLVAAAFTGSRLLV